MIIVLMGVSGAGKTTVGQYLAQGLRWTFYEGDDFHPATNIHKMMRGIPLTDRDRQPWIQAIHRLVKQLQEAQQSAVIACSALKQAYRDQLRDGAEDMLFVYLQGHPEMLRRRLEQRQGHFMGVELLHSQLATLEIPQAAVTIDIDQPLAAIAQEICTALSLPWQL